MTQRYELTDPDRFSILEKKRTWRGPNQAWYAQEEQRQAGGGPTCAAALVSYLAHSREVYRRLYPELSWEKAPILALMEEMWKHMTPGRKGIHTLHLFTTGLLSFAEEKGVTLPIRTLDVPALRLARPTVDQCAAFLRSALSADAPVAFFNRSAGKAKEVEDGHWVIITTLVEHSEGPLMCTCLDQGRVVTADFRLWFQTSRAGGGLVYIPKA